MKLNKKVIALLLAVLLVLAAIPTVSAATPTVEVKMDSDYYKKGETIEAEVWVYNAKITSIDICLTFDGDVVNLGKTGTVKRRNDYLSGINWYNAGSQEGIFSETKCGWDNTSADGYAFFGVYVDVNASGEGVSVLSDGSDGSEKSNCLTIGSNGMKIGTITFLAEKDGAPNIKLGTGKFADSKGEILSLFETSGCDLGSVSGEEVTIEPEKTPYADAQKFKAAVDEIGTVTAASEDKIKAAEALYAKLDDTAKEIAKDSTTKLETAKKEFENLSSVDQALANEIIALINSYEADELKYEDLAKVDEAYATFLTLDKAVLDLIPAATQLKALAIYNAAKALKAEITKVEEAIALIPAEVTNTPENAELVGKATAAYDALVAMNKNLEKGLKEESVKKLEAAKAKLGDYGKAAAVEAKIEALPTEITLDNKEAVEEARKAYDNLTDAQKALVTNLEKLEAAEKALDELKSVKEKADEVTALINSYDADELKYEDLAKVDAAYKQFTELDAEILSLITEETKAKALALYTEAQELKAEIAKVETLIDAIPAEVTSEEECVEKVEAADTAYKALVAMDKGLEAGIAKEDKDKLDAAVAKVADDVAAKAVENKIAGLPETITWDEKEAVEEARKAYDALTDAQKALVTNLEKLETAEKAIEAIKEDKAKAEEADKLIEAIGEVTLAGEEAIKEAREAYDALTDVQKDLVEKYEALTAAEEKLAELKAEVQAVITAIDELPEEITPADTESVTAIRALYDALTEEQKALVTNYDVLTAAEEKLADYIAAAEVDKAIEALGEATFVNEPEIVEAKTLYNELTQTQKALVKAENVEKVDALLEELALKQAVVDEYIAEYGEEILVIEDQTGYLNITATIRDVMTAEDKDLIVEGKIIAYAIIGAAEETPDDADFSDLALEAGETPFGNTYAVAVAKSVASLDGEEVVVEEEAMLVEIPGAITVEYTIPEDMLLSSEQTTRHFSAFAAIMADEEVAVERIADIDENANTLTFIINGSTAFIPTYLDTENPMTGDCAAIYGVTLMMVILTAIVIDRKRKAA